MQPTEKQIILDALDQLEALDRQGEGKIMQPTEKQIILDVLNQLEVIDRQGGEDAYCLVANTEENREQLRGVGVSDEVIDRYAGFDKEDFCIYTLAFSEGFADLIDSEDNLIAFNQSVTVKKDPDPYRIGSDVVFYRHRQSFGMYIEHSNGWIIDQKLTEKQISDIRNLLDTGSV